MAQRIPGTFPFHYFDKKKPEFYELDITIHLQIMWRLLLEHISYEPKASGKMTLNMNGSGRSFPI